MKNFVKSRSGVVSFMNMNKSKLKYFISPIIVFLLLILIYVLNNIYPFGSNTISNGDMGKAYTVIYYYMWDIFHGKANIFINFDVGMGTNMYDLTSVYGILSPFSWLIAFTERSNIPNFISYLLMLKLCFISVTSFILFDNCYKKLDLFWKVLFSVIYAFSGWVIVYHTNFVWLDNVMLFPLLILGMKKIVDNGSYLLYTVILFLSLSYSYYISYMEILFIIFSSFGYLKFFCNKHEKKHIIFKLGLGTFFALVMSSVFWVPVLFQTFTSIRFSLEWTVDFFSFLEDKLMIVMFFGLPIILFGLLIFSKNTSKKVKKFILFLFFIMCIGVFLDPINAMWHAGTYAYFPFRYGFIVVMVIYLGALYYLNGNPNLNFNNSVVSYCSIGLLFCVLIGLFYKYIPISRSSNSAVYLGNPSLIFFVYFILGISFLLVIYIILIKRVRIKRVLLCLFIGISIVGFSLGYIGFNSSDLPREDTDVTLFETNLLYKFLNNGKKEFNRYKNLNYDLISNYPFISSKSSISSWHMVDSSSFNLLRKLGYYVYFTQITEKGGTLFSDNLLGINKYISYKELDSRLYRLIDENDKFKLYELKSFLDYGFIYDTNTNVVSLNDTKNSVDFQNNIYKSLFKKDDEILEKISYVLGNDDDLEVGTDICSSKDESEVTFQLKVDQLSKVYFYYDVIDFIVKDQNYEQQTAYINSIKVNGQFVFNSVVNSYDNKTFVSEDGFIDLGLYDSEVVEVVISLNNNFCIKDFQFVSLDLQKLENLISEYKNEVNIQQKSNKLIINVFSDSDDKSLFLPLNYLNGYEIVLNDKNVLAKKVLDNFVSIDLEKGNNKIVLTYYPPYFKICLIISILSFIIFIIFLRFKFHNISEGILNIFLFMYYLVFLFMFFYVYIYAFFRL